MNLLSTAAIGQQTHLTGHIYESTPCEDPKEKVPDPNGSWTTVEQNDLMEFTCDERYILLVDGSPADRVLGQCTDGPVIMQPVPDSIECVTDFELQMDQVWSQIQGNMNDIEYPEFDRDQTFKKGDEQENCTPLPAYIEKGVEYPRVEYKLAIRGNGNGNSAKLYTAFAHLRELLDLCVVEDGEHEGEYLYRPQTDQERSETFHYASAIFNPYTTIHGVQYHNIDNDKRGLGGSIMRLSLGYIQRQWRSLVAREGIDPKDEDLHRLLHYLSRMFVPEGGNPFYIIHTIKTCHAWRFDRFDENGRALRAETAKIDLNGEKWELDGELGLNQAVIETYLAKINGELDKPKPKKSKGDKALDAAIWVLEKAQKKSALSKMRGRVEASRRGDKSAIAKVGQKITRKQKRTEKTILKHLNYPTIYSHVLYFMDKYNARMQRKRAYNGQVPADSSDESYLDDEDDRMESGMEFIEFL